jgi:signal transduction histidine kinase
MIHPEVRLRDRLWFRFLTIAGAIAVVGGFVGYLVADRVAHRSFDPGLLAGMDPAEEHRRFEAAIDRSLVITLLATATVAVFIALLVRWRLTRPIESIRSLLAHLGDGRYGERVELPSEPELAQVADDVNRLSEALDRSEERRRTLVADLTHEIRGPLATLGGYIEAMQDGLVPCTPELLAELGQECRRLDRLTADLSLLSRIDEGAVPLHLERLGLGAAVRRVVDRLQPQFDASAVSVQVREDAPCDVLADPDRLDQILVNVVGNALKYTPAGGWVEVVTARRGTAGRVRVSDSGVGIEASDIDRVFDRFFRGSSAEHREGTGIGLTIARGLARAQGGDLAAESPGPGRGATFTLDLPSA